MADKPLNAPEETPGVRGSAPWQVVTVDEFYAGPYKGGGYICYGIVAGDVPVATFVYRADHPDPQEAQREAKRKAMLAAKAPEMYALLANIPDYLDKQAYATFVFANDGSRRCAPLSRVIRELLAEARGESPDGK